MMFLGLRTLGNICCGHKMFLNKIRNIFCVPGTKFVSATNVARAGKRGNICVGNNVSATMRPRLPGPLEPLRDPFSDRLPWADRENLMTRLPLTVVSWLSSKKHFPFLNNKCYLLLKHSTLVSVKLLRGLAQMINRANKNSQSLLIDVYILRYKHSMCMLWKPPAGSLC